MAESKLFVGHVEVVALTDNSRDFPIPLSELFPNAPADAWAPFRQRYPEVFSGPDTWHNHYGCYLLRSQGRTILVDTGLGSKATNPGAVNKYGGASMDGSWQNCTPPVSVPRRWTLSSSRTCIPTMSAGT
jgi:hypothetical protein